MLDSRPITTPRSTTNLSINKDGDTFREIWDFTTILGMLVYLANNSGPGITFAVYQCVRFTHVPHHSHTMGITRIPRYLNGTKDKDMTIIPTKEHWVDYYVDADFAGLFGIEQDQDHVSVKSITGDLITFMGVPLQWVSKLQTQIALSTMEAEYIALP